MLGLKMPLMKNNYSKTVSFISGLTIVLYICGIVYSEHTEKTGFLTYSLSKTPHISPTHSDKCSI